MVPAPAFKQSMNRSAISQTPEHLKNQPVRANREKSGFYRAKDFTIRGRAKCIEISSEISVFVRRQRIPWDESGAISKVVAEFRTRTKRECMGYLAGRIFHLTKDLYSPMDIFNEFDSMDQDGCDFASDVAINNQVDLYSRLLKSILRPAVTLHEIRRLAITEFRGSLSF